MLKIGYLWIVVQVRDRAWFVRLYGEIIPVGIIDRTGAETMLYLTCTTITRVDLAHYGVSRAKDWVSLDCGTMPPYRFISVFIRIDLLSPF